MVAHIRSCSAWCGDRRLVLDPARVSSLRTERRRCIIWLNWRLVDMREHRVVAKLYVLFEIAVTASVIVCAAAAVVPRNLFEHVPLAPRSHATTTLLSLSPPTLLPQGGPSIHLALLLCGSCRNRINMPQSVVVAPADVCCASLVQH
jgi:hypothetical protein